MSLRTDQNLRGDVANVRAMMELESKYHTDGVFVDEYGQPTNKAQGWGQRYDPKGVVPKSKEKKDV